MKVERSPPFDSGLLAWQSAQRRVETPHFGGDKGGYRHSLDLLNKVYAISGIFNPAHLTIRDDRLFSTTSQLRLNPRFPETLAKREILARSKPWHVGCSLARVPAPWLPPLGRELLSKKLAKGLDVSFGAYNLFDQKYAHPGSEEHLQDAIEQDGEPPFEVYLPFLV